MTSSATPGKDSRNLFPWICKICPRDVARYLFEFCDFSTIIFGVQLVNKEIRNVIFEILNEKWWIRVANHRWEGYFSDALLEWISKNVENLEEWEGACNFTLNKSHPIYSIISNIQADAEEYLRKNMNDHLKVENESIVELPVYKLPSHLISKHKIPTFVQRCLLFRRWEYEEGASSPLKHIPCSFILGDRIEDIITNQKGIEDLADWNGDGLPVEAPLHPFVTWLYEEDMEESTCLNGFYTGPVYVYEEEWNKDWGVAVQSEDYNPEDDDEEAQEILENERDIHGSTRIRKFYWPDPDYFPIIRYEIYQCTFELGTKSALKGSDKILELLRTNPQKLNGYSYGPRTWGYENGGFRDGMVRFPCHLLADCNGFGIDIDPSDHIYKYIPKYSEYWMEKVCANLKEAMHIEDFL